MYQHCNACLLQEKFVKAAELITDAVAEEKGNIAYGFSKVGGGCG